MKQSKNLKTVLESLKDEVNGDVSSALRKITDDYSMTWMYQKGESVFPTTGGNMKLELEEVYHIKGRKYDIRNVAENDDLIILELIESYPDPKTGKIYRTPEVIVLEMKDGKIKKGRHYCDPRVSYMHLSEKAINDGLKNTRSKLIVD